MYISKIRIKNFRGIKEQTLDFTKFSTLIGKNDCGKSTIINAIKIFFNDEKVTKKDFNYYEKLDKNIEIEVKLSGFEVYDLRNYLVDGDKDNGFTEIVKCYIIDDTFTIKKTWEHKDTSEIAAKTEILIKEFEKYKLHEAKLQDLKKLNDSLDAQPDKDSAGNNSNTERKAVIIMKLNDLGEKTVTEFVGIKYADIKDSLPSVELLKADQSIDTTTTEFKNTFSTEVKAIIRSEREKNQQSTLNDIENIISSKIKEESIIIKNCMSEHVSGLTDLKITPNFSWEKGVEITDVQIKLDNDEEFIPLENKGSGYRRLFMVGRLRYLADKNRSKNVIYLVEEPETFLHPSAQEEMLNSLISLSESNQIFITTHSPIFTGATKQNSITLSKNEKTHLIYEQRSDDGFLSDIAQQLGVKPHHNILDNYKVIIFVEGSNDMDFIKIASKKLKKNPKDKSIDDYVQSGAIAVLPGGGKTLENFIDIAFFEKQGKKMFLIIDSDKYDPEQITNEVTRNSLDNKIIENQELKNKFDKKTNSKCFILNKKNIDTYYHPRAIKRLNHNFPLTEVFADNFCYTTYVDNHKAQIKGNIRNKNWIEAFEAMTPQEWKEVSNNELEQIFDEILALATNT